MKNNKRRGGEEGLKREGGLIRGGAYLREGGLIEDSFDLKLGIDFGPEIR